MLSIRLILCPLLLLPLLLLTTACEAGPEGNCGRWKLAAKSFASCFGPALPPVASTDDIECVDEDDFEGNDDHASIDECRNWLDDNRVRVCDLGTEIITDPNYEVCTSGVVLEWTPPDLEDDCEQWKHAISSLHWCDVSVIPDPSPSDECRSDEESIDLYGMTVADCAEHIYARTYPCLIPLGDERSTCTDLIAH